MHDPIRTLPQWLARFAGPLAEFPKCGPMKLNASAARTTTSSKKIAMHDSLKTELEKDKTVRT
jgi:hypothetical protein